MNEISVSNKPGAKFSFFDIILAFLALYVLVILGVELFVTFSPETQKIINIFDNVVCSLFLFDFCRKFYKAESKLSYMRWGWLDLLASIPNVEMFRFFWGVRVIRIIRILRALKSFKMILDLINTNRLKFCFHGLVFLIINLVMFSSIGILHFEKNHPEANIKTAEEAIYYTFTVLSTTGFGDFSCKSLEGRVLSIFLMCFGVGLFSVFTGYIASFFSKSNNN